MSPVTDESDMADRPRFLGRLGPADAVTAANAVLGFLAVVVAPTDARLAARLLLVAAITDALDGIVARRFGGTEVGPHLDSLADVSSFGVAPAVLLLAVTPADGVLELAAFVVGGLFVAFAVVRLGVYTVEDEGRVTTHGVPTALAMTVVAAATLAGIDRPALLVGATALLAVGMVTPIVYPDLHAQDAAVMGVVQMLAVATSGRVGEVFAFAVLFLAVGYTVFGPRFYWRDVPEEDQPGTATAPPDTPGGDASDATSGSTQADGGDAPETDDAGVRS